MDMVVITEKLRKITDHNNRILDTYDHNVNEAIKNNEEIYLLVDEHSGQVVYDFFMDSSYRFNVDPVKEYDLESLITVIKKFEKEMGK